MNMRRASTVLYMTLALPVFAHAAAAQPAFSYTGLYIPEAGVCYAKLAATVKDANGKDTAYPLCEAKCQLDTQADDARRATADAAVEAVNDGWATWPVSVNREGKEIRVGLREAIWGVINDEMLGPQDRLDVSRAEDRAGVSDDGYIPSDHPRTEALLDRYRSAVKKIWSDYEGRAAAAFDRAKADALGEIAKRIRANYVARKNESECRSACAAERKDAEAVCQSRFAQLRKSRCDADYEAYYTNGGRKRGVHGEDAGPGTACDYFNDPIDTANGKYAQCKAAYAAQRDSCYKAPAIQEPRGDERYKPRPDEESARDRDLAEAKTAQDASYRQYGAGVEKENDVFAKKVQRSAVDGIVQRWFDEWRANHKAGTSAAVAPVDDAEMTKAMALDNVEADLKDIRSGLQRGRAARARAMVQQSGGPDAVPMLPNIDVAMRVASLTATGNVKSARVRAAAGGDKSGVGIPGSVGSLLGWLVGTGPKTSGGVNVGGVVPKLSAPAADASGKSALNAAPSAVRGAPGVYGGEVEDTQEQKNVKKAVHELADRYKVMEYVPLPSGLAKDVAGELEIVPKLGEKIIGFVEERGRQANFDQTWLRGELVGNPGLDFAERWRKAHPAPEGTPAGEVWGADLYFGGFKDNEGNPLPSFSTRPVWIGDGSSGGRRMWPVDEHAKRQGDYVIRLQPESFGGGTVELIKLGHKKQEKHNAGTASNPVWVTRVVPPPPPEFYGPWPY